MVQWHDSWFTSRQQWFNSTRDYLPRYANGRAVWLKPKRMQVQILLWAVVKKTIVAR